MDQKTKKNEKNYLFKIRKNFIEKELIPNENSEFFGALIQNWKNLNLQNNVVISLLIFYSFPKIKKIFENPFFNMNLKKINKKIHSNLITNFANILNNLEVKKTEKNLKDNLKDFYFSLIKKEKSLSSHLEMNLSVN